MTDGPNRRDLLARLSAAGFASLALPAETFAQGTELPATPACEGHASATQRQTEGPYFTPSSPQRTDLRSDGDGTLLVLSGFVLTRQCRPVPGALLDFWHADTSGSTTIAASVSAAISSPTSRGATSSSPARRASIPAAPATFM